MLLCNAEAVRIECKSMIALHEYEHFQKCRNIMVKNSLRKCQILDPGKCSNKPLAALSQIHHGERKIFDKKTIPTLSPDNYKGKMFLCLSNKQVNFIFI